MISATGHKGAPHGAAMHLKGPWERPPPRGSLKVLLALGRQECRYLSHLVG